MPSAVVRGRPVITQQHIRRESRSRLVARAVAATKVATDKKAPAKSVEMSPETAADLYRDMMLGRDFEDMCAQMYYRGKMFGARALSDPLFDLRLPLPYLKGPPHLWLCPGPQTLRMQTARGRIACNAPQPDTLVGRMHGPHQLVLSRRTQWLVAA